MPTTSRRALRRAREALFAAALATSLMAASAAGQSASEPVPRASKDGPGLRFEFPEI